VSLLLETSSFAAMRQFDYRDGGLGRLWLEKFRMDANKQLSAGKGTILGTTSIIDLNADSRHLYRGKPRQPIQTMPLATGR
jgi:hypothetical protein